MSRTVLRGREAERDLLGRVLDERRSPGAVVSGSAGVGKSALVDDLAVRASAQGWDVRVGRATSLDTGLPFGPVAQALGLSARVSDARTARVAALVRGEDARPGRRRWSAVDGVVDLLDALSRTRPVLVVVEDLQWADVDTLALLARLWHAGRQLDIAVVATVRPRPLRAEVAAALREAGAAGCLAVELGDLPPQAVEALASDLLGAPPGATLRAALASAGGNPLLAAELLAALGQRGCLDTTGGVAELRGDVPADVVAAPLLARLDVDPWVRHLLSQAAVLGRGFRVAELAAVRHERVEATWAALQPAVDAGLVVVEAGATSLRHDLVQEALYRSLPDDVRRAAHDEVAVALHAAGAADERVGVHLARGALAPASADRLLDLAEALVDRAPDLALQWSRAAQAAAPPAGALRVRARALEARAAALAEDPRTAITIARSLLASGAATDVAASVWATVAQAEAYLGESSPETAEALARLLHDLPRDHPARQRLGALAARALRAVGRHAEAVVVAESVLSPAVDEWQEDDPAARSVALGVLARQALADGDAERAFDLADRGLATVLEAGTLLEWSGVEMVKDFGWVRAIDTSDDRLVDVCEQILARGEQAGLRAALPAVEAELAETLRFRGRWQEAEAHARAAVEGLGGSRYATAATDAWFTLLVIASRRGDVEAFARTPPPLVRAESDDVNHGGLTLLHAWALAHAGHTDEAWAVAEQARHWYETDAPEFMVVWSHPYVLLAVARGEHDRAAGFAAFVRGAAARMRDHPAVLAQARLAHAVVHQDVVAAREAVALARRGPVMPNLLDALVSGGEVLAVAGDRADATAWLQEGRALAARAEATTDLLRIDAALRRLGVRRTRPRSRPTTGWGALTEVEARVVSSVVGGRTYREAGEELFISRRTVETHVASAFRKVGVRSRHELVAAWHARQPDAPDPHDGDTAAGPAAGPA